ncbi:MAG: 1,4-dihydroxy-6-naphthoate synthase [Desulfobacterota bacterium]|nr:1,4-dihydroxy-6-naphthoate synthase [Thermodesulfobacteriota bacterium]
MAQPALSLGISPCPNDTFIFEAWINGRLGPHAPKIISTIADIDALNHMAENQQPDIVKVSVFAYGRLHTTYKLLDAGAALGRGCGPLVVARSQGIDLADPDITIAVPGRWTTAHCLLSLSQPAAAKKIFMPFDRIMPAVVHGEADVGVIVHEGRFTYSAYGLVMVEDLGAWWETTTGYPVPLGVIVAKRSLGSETIAKVETAIRESLRAAWENPATPRAFMRRYAAEMDEEVMQRHVELYVNQYTYDLGDEGKQAIAYLLQWAREQGLFA